MFNAHMFMDLQIVNLTINVPAAPGESAVLILATIALANNWPPLFVSICKIIIK